MKTPNLCNCDLRPASPPLPPPAAIAPHSYIDSLPLRLSDSLPIILSVFLRRDRFLILFGYLLREIKMMKFSRTCRQGTLKEVTSSLPVYLGASDASGGGLSLMFRRWATKKSGGSTKNGKDSNPQFLGVKKFGGEKVIPGNIIVRQRGTRFHPGNYVGIGKDHTLFALKEGNVRFERHKLSGRKYVNVDPKDGHMLHPIYANLALDHPIYENLVSNRPTYKKSASKSEMKEVETVQ